MVVVVGEVVHYFRRASRNSWNKIEAVVIHVGKNCKTLKIRYEKEPGQFIEKGVSIDSIDKIREAM